MSNVRKQNKNACYNGKTRERRTQPRSSVACLSCRIRKVRCDVVIGAPCSNCKLDMIECIVRRDRRNRKHFTSLLPTVVARNHLTEIQDNPKSSPTSQPAQGTSSVKGNEIVAYRSMPVQGGDGGQVQTISGWLTSIERDEAHSWQRLPHFIEPICGKALSTGHLKFLDSQGAFDLPPWPLQRALVEAYAEFAYPYMPLMQLHEFLGSLDIADNGHSKRYSLLLYLGILFAGAAFVDHKLLEGDTTGFSTRKSARRELMKRATLLHDLGIEKDRIVLTQAALLMSSWSDVSHDHKDSWHWMGLAVTSAFAAGLNSLQSPQQIGRSEHKLRKRIWWSCYMRDRFLALGLRRPIRIRDVDVSVPGLEVSDFEIATLCRDNTIIESENSVLYQFSKQIELAEICIHRSRLSSLIEGVLNTQNAYDCSEQPSKSTDSNQSKRDLEDMFAHSAACLELWKASIPDSCGYRLDKDEEVSPSIVLHQSHLQMSFHTLLYTLHRPRFLPSVPKQTCVFSTLFSKGSGREVLVSALEIARIATDLRRLGLDCYLPVSGVTIIFPAMVICLLEMKAESLEVRQRASTRFESCMKVMERLQETYIAADLAINYFKAALKKQPLSLLPSPQHENPMDSSSAECIDEMQQDTEPIFALKPSMLLAGQMNEDMGLLCEEELGITAQIGSLPVSPAASQVGTGVELALRNETQQELDSHVDWDILQDFEFDFDVHLGA